MIYILAVDGDDIALIDAAFDLLPAEQHERRADVVTRLSRQVRFQTELAAEQERAALAEAQAAETRAAEVNAPARDAMH
jgi:hypothetical protein